MEVAEGGAGVGAGGGGAGGEGGAGAGAVGVTGGGPGPGPGPGQGAGPGPGPGPNGALAGNSSGEGGDVAGSRWGSGVWSAGAGAGAGAGVGEGGTFQAMSAGYRQQQGWPQQIQTGSGTDEHADATHVEAKETRRGSHMSVGTLPLTSSESLGDGEGGVFFSAET